MLKIKTEKLQEMVSKSIKGASNNNMIPITSLVAISLKDEVLTLTTTDATNTLEIIEKGIKEEDFYVAVQAELFSKLVAKTTAENIELKVMENSLEVKGNGVYNIEIPLDEQGTIIRFPTLKISDKAKTSVIKLSDLKLISSANKAALAMTMESPCLTGYYFDDTAITTDSFKVCSSSVKMFSEKALLPAELIDLLLLCEEDTIQVQRFNGKLIFTTKSVVIYGSELPEIDKYPASSIEAYLKTEFQSYCTCSRDEILKALDRLLLFVTPYDKNGVYITFSENSLSISSKKSNSVETIKYKSSENFQPFTACIDIELFQSQISAQSGDTVQIWYNHPTAVKLTTDKITQIIALLQDDRG